MLEQGLARAEVGRTFLQQVRNRLRPTIDATAWAERYYPPALELEVPAPWRPVIERFVAEEIGLMGPDDVATVRSWGRHQSPGGRA